MTTNPSARVRRDEHEQGVDEMPPRGVKKGTKRARQYEHIKQSELDSGKSESRAEEIAARTVQSKSQPQRAVDGRK